MFREYLRLVVFTGAAMLCSAVLVQASASAPLVTRTVIALL